MNEVKVVVQEGGRLDGLEKRLFDIEESIAGLNPRNLAGIRSKDLIQATIANLFGDGSDDDVVISSGTTTLTRDMFYKNLTISGTGILNTASFRVYVSQDLKNSVVGG